MHSTSWLAPLVLVLGCASQSSNANRQLHEQEERLRRLTANYDRLEERVIALEATTKVKSIGKSAEPRPELPTVRVTPDHLEAEPLPMGEGSADIPGDDNHRVVIVGEGSRVEARAAGEVTTTPVARPSGKGNPRASKANQGSLPKASTPGASQ